MADSNKEPWWRRPQEDSQTLGRLKEKARCTICKIHDGQGHQLPPRTLRVNQFCCDIPVYTVGFCEAHLSALAKLLPPVAELAEEK